MELNTIRAWINPAMQQTQEPSSEEDQISTEDTLNHVVFIYMTVTLITGSGVSCLGVWTNILSMAIFSKLGLKDSMSVELFALSFTDFLVATIQLANYVSYIIAILYPDSSVDTMSLTTLVGGYSLACVYFVSSWITTLISIERCLLVVYPFKVKQIFTRSRCIAAILIIYVIFIFIHAPVYVVFKAAWVKMASSCASANTSETRKLMFTVIVNDETMFFEQIYDLLMSLTMTLMIQVIVIVCSFWMGYSLLESSRIRNTSSGPIHAHSTEHKSSLTLKSASTLTNREKRLVKVVLILGILVITGNVPKLVILMVYHLVLPNIDDLIQKYVHTILWSSYSLCVAIGSSTNFLVFIKLNSSYMMLFSQLCSELQHRFLDLFSSCSATAIMACQNGKAIGDEADKSSPI